MAITGGCRCGACRYEIAGDTLPPVYACHCHICQRASGSAFSVQALVDSTVFSTTGPIVTREYANAERVSVQRFCGECLARIYNTNSLRPGLVVVRAGTLDRSEELSCHGHIFTHYRQRWVEIPDATPQWPEAPEPAELVALMIARPN